MIQQWIFCILFVQITFSMMAMEKNLVRCQDCYGEIIDLEEWKVKESKFLYERKLIQDDLRLHKPIYAELVTKKELELFSQALDWREDLTLLYYYVRLPWKERHMLLDVVRESKLQAEELQKRLTIFYVTGLYMKELIELEKNLLFDVDMKVSDVGNKMWQLIGNEEKPTLYDGWYDDAIQYANRNRKLWQT